VIANELTAIAEEAIASFNKFFLPPPAKLISFTNVMLEKPLEN
jgi:hypothetical protein